jgi:hypothetical protein
MAKDKGTREGVAAPDESDTPTQEDVDAAVAAENDAARNAQEAAIEEADERAKVHGQTVIRGQGPE